MSVLKTLVKLLLGKGVYASYAQFGEDLIIRPFVPRTGVYVDVGCYHPVLYSNTYRLYKLGWQGIVIDANPKLKKLFSIVRPRDRFVETAIGTAGGQLSYFEFSDGAYNTFSPELAQDYQKRTKLVAEHPISIRPLSEVLAGVSHIDVMSIDVEGLDLEVLKSHDWSVIPTIIIIETQPGSAAFQYVTDKGYSLIGLTKLNAIFRHAGHGN
jgi:FkbM family methyltransferase